jgi:hypothetical protein
LQEGIGRYFAQNGKSFEVAVDGALVVNDVPFALRAAQDSRDIASFGRFSAQGGN